MVRHGQARNNVERRLAGRMEGFQLTPKGVGQAECAASMLAEIGVSAVYSSPIERAADTAGIISKKCGVPLTVDERLTEIDMGKFTGMTFEEVALTHGDISAKFYGADVEIAHKGVETFAQVRRRTSDVVSHVISAHSCGGDDDSSGDVADGGDAKGAARSGARENVVLVTHMDPIKAVLGMAVEMPTERLIHMEVANASLNVFRVGHGDDGLSLLALNVMDASRFAA